MITQEKLKQMFDYDPGGYLVYRVNPKGRAKKGDRAGAQQPNGYWHIMINRKRYFAHRLIFMYHHGFIPTQIDHIDRDKSNNRIENLRKAEHRQNMWNKEITPTSSKSGYRGVIWLPDRGRWLAYSRYNGKMKYLGHFLDPHSAAIAYNDFVIKTRGEFAVLNEIRTELPHEFRNPIKFTGLNPLEYVS